MQSVGFTAPARDVRRAIAGIERQLTTERDPEMHRLLWELGSLYCHVLYRRGLTP